MLMRGSRLGAGGGGGIMQKRKSPDFRFPEVYISAKLLVVVGFIARQGLKNVGFNGTMVNNFIAPILLLTCNKSGTFQRFLYCCKYSWEFVHILGNCPFVYLTELYCLT